MRKQSVFLCIMIGCGNDAPRVSADLPEGDTALCVALGGDYVNGVGTMAAIGLPSLTVLPDLVPNAISGDPVLRLHGGTLYVVNRDANNVTVIDPTTDPWSVKSQFSTGPSSDPQDVALAGSRAYVTLYTKPEIQVWDLSDPAPAAPVATIDLSSYDPDGNPNANSIVVSGSRAYVTLDLLDTQMYPKPRGKGKVLVLDTATNQVVTTLDLVYENPYDFIFARGDRLLVSTFDDFSGARGCLEQIVPGPEPRIDPCLVENRVAGGIVNSIAVGPTETYVAVSAFDELYNQTASIRRISSDGALMPDPMTPSDQIPTDVAYSPSGHLVYSDVASGGIHVIDLSTSQELTTAPLSIGLTPATANAIVCMAR